MDSHYAAQYRRLHEQHWWWRSRQHAVLSELARIAPAGGTERILDVGCGDALMFDALAPFGQVEGVEVDDTLLSPDNPWRRRIHACPFDDRFRPGQIYTTILMLDVLEHLPDPRSALRHAVSLLASRGTLLVTVPAFRLLWTSHDELNHHYTRFNRRTFRRLANGIATIRSMRYLFHWLFPAKLAVRCKELLVATEPRPPRIPPPPVNRTLDRLTRLEHSLLGRVPLPFGSSLMATLGRVAS